MALRVRCAVCCVAFAASTAPLGELFAMVGDEYVDTIKWAPSTTCTDPPFGPCANGTSCCHDPAVVPVQGACYKVTDCSEMKDTNITIGLRLVRIDMEGEFISSPSLPMSPHSGATSRPVHDSHGNIYLQLARVSGGRVLYSIAQFLDASPAAPMFQSECVLGHKLSGLWFDKQANALVGGDLNGTHLLRVSMGSEQPSGATNAGRCVTTQTWALPEPMVDFIPAPPGSGLPPFAMPARAAVDDLTAQAPSVLYYAHKRTVLGVDLGTGRLLSNITFPMSLSSQVWHVARTYFACCTCTAADCWCATLYHRSSRSLEQANWFSVGAAPPSWSSMWPPASSGKWRCRRTRGCFGRRLRRSTWC